MHIKSVLAGAAIALAAGVGSAFAADQFSALEGISVTTNPASDRFATLERIPAELMSDREMEKVAGRSTNITVNLQGDELFSIFLDAPIQGAIFFLITVDQSLTGVFSNGLGTSIGFNGENTVVTPPSPPLFETPPL